MKKKTLIIPAILISIAVLLSGCVTQTYTDGEEEGKTESGSGTGYMNLYVSDAPADIGDFDLLNVTFQKTRIFRVYNNSQENWTVSKLNDTVDLTTLVGPNATQIANITLEAGNYSKVELYVESTYGTVDDEEVEVFVPSGKLMITKEFSVEDNETLKFVFDINVIKRGHQSVYNLQPVISESGVVGEDLGEDDFEDVAEKDEHENEEEDTEEENEDDEEEGEITKEPGYMNLFISDKPADIGDFDLLNVTFHKTRIFRINNNSEENWTMTKLNDTVDLTTLVGPNATQIANITLEAGNYSKVELYVESTYGLVDGEEVKVFVPSGKLMITKNFTIEVNETLKFVFDINVVKRGHQDVYNLIPVISESGVVGKDIDEEDFKDVDREKHGKGLGHMNIMMNNSKADIDDFDLLNVTFYKMRIFRTYNDTEDNWTEREINDTVDLTELVDTNSSQIANISLKAGNYSKIEFYVETTYGVVDGNETRVFVPSGKLMIVENFSVKENETLKFSFDIKVVKRGRQNVYNLIPVIAKGDSEEE